MMRVHICAVFSALLLSGCDKEPPQIVLKPLTVEKVPVSLLVKRQPVTCLPNRKELKITELTRAYTCKADGEEQAIASLDALQTAVRDREAQMDAMVAEANKASARK